MNDITCLFKAEANLAEEKVVVEAANNAYISELLAVDLKKLDPG